MLQDRVRHVTTRLRSTHGTSGWIELAAISSVTCLASLLLGFLVRRGLTEAFWVVRPVLYVTWVEHVVEPKYQAFAWAQTAVFTIVLSILIYAVRNSEPRLRITLSVIGGLMVGGSFANHIEAAAVGGVTDFIGIRTVGIYSAGDIGIDVGVALLPIAAVNLAAEYRVSFRLPLGVVVAVFVMLIALVTAHPAPVVGYLVVPVSGLVGLVAVVATKLRRRLARRAPAALSL